MPRLSCSNQVSYALSIKVFSSLFSSSVPSRTSGITGSSNDSCIGYEDHIGRKCRGRHFFSFFLTISKLYSSFNVAVAIAIVAEILLPLDCSAPVTIRFQINTLSKSAATFVIFHFKCILGNIFIVHRLSQNMKYKTSFDNKPYPVFWNKN